MTGLGAVSSTSEIISKLDASSQPGADNHSPLNPRCMTTADCVEAQSKGKNVGEIIHLLRMNELQFRKGKETDSQELKQFIRQQNRLLMKNGILYHKNEIQEVNCPDKYHAIGTSYSF